ncbi:uncharacterized protein LOC129598307 [Paramacrobiotus metropolitanus]|uniref:uncharacterized protein LOC129598307 n=1 Tax=Paramacrobiotus metropolitanus TaxID=2943436 RepID=UPI002445F2ED|nr:uncharacterized protein LOC129598307 [Paramacrobiotus metropolitanus]
MLIYTDAVAVWNAVDVQLDDGPLQHGYVIGVVEQGLIVDLQCSRQRSQFVEYGRVFRYTEYERAPVQRGTAKAQVLLRRQLKADAPWVWYAGRVVPHVGQYADGALLVQVQLPHGTVQELVPAWQVRAPPADADLSQRRVKKDDFVVRCCPLPAAYWSAGMPQLEKIFNEEMDESCRLFIARLHQTVLYLQKAYYRDQLDAEQLEKVCQMATAEGSSIASHSQLGPAQPVLAVTVSSGSKRRKVLDSSAGCLALPAVVLLEMFRALDSIERVRCRRVCGLWNDLLTTEAHFPEVRVSAEVDDYGDQEAFDEDSMYWALAGILKALSRRTKLLVITRRFLGSVEALFPAIKLQLNGGRLPLLVFYQCDFGSDRLSFLDVIELAAGVAVQCPCERLLWKDCYMYDGFLQADIAHHEFSVQSRDSQQTMELQLWGLFEANLVVEQPVDLPALQAVIAATHPPAGTGQCQLSNRRVNILSQGLDAEDGYQAADPRPTTAHYRHWNWRSDTMAEVDVHQLNKLSAAFLAKVYREPQSDEWNE